MPRGVSRGEDHPHPARDVEAAAVLQHLVDRGRLKALGHGPHLGPSLQDLGPGESRLRAAVDERRLDLVGQHSRAARLLQVVE